MKVEWGSFVRLDYDILLTELGGGIRLVRSEQASVDSGGRSGRVAGFGGEAGRPA